MKREERPPPRKENLRRPIEIFDVNAFRATAPNDQRTRNLTEVKKETAEVRKDSRDWGWLNDVVCAL